MYSIWCCYKKIDFPNICLSNKQDEFYLDEQGINTMEMYFENTIEKDLGNFAYSLVIYSFLYLSIVSNPRLCKKAREICFC